MKAPVIMCGNTQRQDMASIEQDLKVCYGLTRSCTFATLSFVETGHLSTINTSYDTNKLFQQEKAGIEGQENRRPPEGFEPEADELYVAMRHKQKTFAPNRLNAFHQKS